MPKAVYREVPEANLGTTFCSSCKTVMFDSLTVETTSGQKLRLKPLTVELPGRWMLERMRQHGIRPHICPTADYDGWTPSPGDMFQQWQIPYETFRADHFPTMEQGDFLVLVSVNNRTAIYEVAEVLA